MVNSISITAFNRPDLLKQVVDSILSNDTSGFTHCYCGIEPERQEENFKELVRLQERFEVFECVFNKSNMGVRKNPFNLLSYVFDEKNNVDFNLYLEDDSLLSPDAFDFVRFYLKNYSANNIMCCNLYNYSSTYTMPKTVGNVFEFCALGVGITKRQWKTWFEPYWFDEQIRIKNEIDLDGKGGWDWSIRAVMKEFSLRVIAPSLSRSYHLGITGTFCDRQCYERQFKNHPYSKFKKTEFSIC